MTLAIITAILVLVSCACAFALQAGKMVETVFVCRCIFSPLLVGGVLMLSMVFGLIRPIKEIAEVARALGGERPVFLVFGPTMILGVLGCWGVFGEAIAPIANCCLLFPPTLAVYGHYKIGATIVPPLVMVAAMTAHLYLS